MTFESGRVKSAPEKNVFSGVWESIVEGALLKQSPGTHFSASAMLSHAASVGENFKVLTPGYVNSQREFRITESAEIWIEEDLAKGYAVIIPAKQFEEDSSRSVWWRIDPKSGETLAMMQGGYGPTFTEYLIFATFVGTTVALVLSIACIITIQASRTNATITDAETFPFITLT